MSALLCRQMSWKSYIFDEHKCCMYLAVQLIYIFGILSYLLPSSLFWNTSSKYLITQCVSGNWKGDRKCSGKLGINWKFASSGTGVKCGYNGIQHDIM